MSNEVAISHFDSMQELLDEMLLLAEEFLFSLDDDHAQSYPDSERLSLRMMVDFLMIENALLFYSGQSLQRVQKEVLKEIKVKHDPGCLLASLTQKAFDFGNYSKKGELSDAEYCRLVPKLEEYENLVEESQYTIYDLFGGETPDLYIEKGWDKEKEVW